MSYKETEKNVLHFLEENPDFLTKNPQALALLTLSDNSDVALLLEKQNAVLKTKLNVEKMALQGLIHTAKNNEKTVNDLHAITIHLLSYTQEKEMLASLPSLLASQFCLDKVVFKKPPTKEASTADKQAYEMTISRFKQRRPLCDDRWPEKILRWFFDESIQSAAILPIFDKQSLLMFVALGDTKKTRFTHDLEISHLQKLSDLLCAALLRLSVK